MKAHLDATGVTRRDPAFAVGTWGDLRRPRTRSCSSAASARLEDQDELPFPPVEAVQKVLTQRAPEIAAARKANARDFVDDGIVRELEASGFPSAARGASGR